jgi:uncharacterized damage-inducible protein DinB
MSSQQVNVDRRLMQWLLHGEWEFADPRNVLSGISPEDACRRVEGLPYSIAQLVAHTDWWQRRRIGLARGEEWQDFELQVDDWPDAAPQDWDRLVQTFLASNAVLLDLVENDLDMGRTLYEDQNVGRMLVSHTLHNAYHLGQIVLMRRLLGIWPPADTGDVPQ